MAYGINTEHGLNMDCYLKANGINTDKSGLEYSLGTNWCVFNKEIKKWHVDVQILKKLTTLIQGK